MRIAILAPHAGHIVGGVEMAAMWLRKYFLIKHECNVFSLSKTPWTTKVSGIKGPHSPLLVKKLRLFYLNHFIPSAYIIKSYAVSEIAYCYNLYPILQRFKPDIIINLTFSILALFCKYYRHKFMVPFINVGQAGCTYMEVKSAMSKPDVYVALTPAAKNYIEKHISDVRVEVIPNGVDLSLFCTKRPKLPIDYFLKNALNTDVRLAPPYILSTSRLVQEKRLDLLIKAVSKLKKGTLIFVGKGENKQKLINLGHKILKNRLLFLDTLNQEELSKLYRACDVFSLPSKNEAFGNVIVEAMASGVPVVATNASGFRWIIGEKGGILVDVKNSHEYAKGLHEAYETNFGDGPEKQAQKFSWSVVVQKYDDLINSLVK